MENFSILGVHGKIRDLGGVMKKAIYEGNCLKRRGGEQFAYLRVGGKLGKKDERWCF